MTTHDAALEARIREEWELCVKAKEEGRSAACRVHYEQFVSLIAQRTPKRVREMEREKGLV